MRLLRFVLLFSILQPSTVRVVTYNLLNFSDEDEREDDYRSILEFIEPDLIIVQEIVGQTGFSHFKSDVLDIIEPNIWSSAPFINQSAQQDIALFYKDAYFTFLSTSAISTAQSSGTRDVIEWIMKHNQSDIEFNLYGVHFKASSGTSNASERLEEATILRNYLNNLSENHRFIVGGDFNIYSNSSSSEPAFNMLTGTSDDNGGQLFDPIDRIGNWHNNSSFADVHTQSTRTTSFGGGANGGMDDRFDWLFVSENILDNASSMYYIEDTYWAVGNDGNHFNDAINNGNNSSVPNEIADALHEASDHLPVYMDIWFDDLVYSDYGIMISEIMVNPGSVSDSYGEWFEITNTTDSTIEIQGWSIRDGNGDEHIIQEENQTIPVLPGNYFVLARNGDAPLNGGLDVNYVYENFSLSNSEDKIILLDWGGAIVDEVHYDDSWAFSSGVSMEIHDIEIDNSMIENWYAATLSYGLGDFGSPGIPYNGTIDIGHSGYLPLKFRVYEPYPNPFNPTITIQIQNDIVEHFLIEVFDLSGRKVQTIYNGSLYVGKNAIEWDASSQSSGTYFFKVSTGTNYCYRKAVLVK